MANPSKPSTGRVPRWLKILGIVCGSLFVLGLIAYFIFTSSGFFKGVILPKVSKAIGADVTVAKAEVHPFSRVVLHDFKVQVKGEEPILNAKEIRANYGLWSIIRGNIVVSEVTVVSPVISLVTQPDGSNNLPKPPPSEEKPEKEKKSSKPSKPLQVDIKKIAITDATIRNVQQFKDGKSNQQEISGFNFSVENIKNGQTGKIALKFNANLVNNPPTPQTAGSASATASGDFSFNLANDLTPSSVNGGLQFNVANASGALSDLAAFTANLRTEVTPTEIKQVALRLSRNNATLGEVVVSGPFDMGKTEGRINVEVHSIDRQALNLIGAASGMDFMTTTINSSNQIEIANGGKRITASGRFALANLQVKRANQTTPTLDLNAAYEIAADTTAGSATLRKFTLDGKENNSSFLNANLTSPMTFASGDPTTGGANDSSLTVTVNNFRLGGWQALAGDLISDGTVNAELNILSQQSGKKLAVDLATRLENLSATMSSNRIEQVGVNFKTHIDATNLKQFQIANYQLNLTQASKSLVSVSGNGSCDTSASTADLQSDANVDLANLISAFPQPGVSAQSGSLNLQAHVAQKQSSQTVTGNLSLSDFSGEFAGSSFRDYASDMTLNLAMNQSMVELRKIAGTLRQGGNAGGIFIVSGQYDLNNSSGKFDLKLDGLNENAVRPFLEPMLAGKKLVSVNITASATAQYDPKAATSVKADAQVTKLVVSDPAAQTPAAPLEAKLQVDAALQNQIADVKQFEVTLTPTDRAKNQMQLQGRVDMSSPNVIHGGLKFLADSLDFTHYYDLFAGQTNASTTATTARTSTPSPAPPGPETEPAPIDLPFRNFNIEAAIGKLFLHEVEVADFKTTLNLDGGHVLLKPFQLSLNGRPVSANADLNLSVPGYQYDVSFNVDAIPLTPLVNTFNPSMRGKLGGTVNASAQIKGAGITGENLQKNLNAQFDVATANMNLAVVDIKNRYLVVLINTITSIPELIKNPTAQASELLTTFRTGRSDVGYAGKINKSPINVVSLKAKAQKGKVDVQDSLVQSAAFQAKAIGTITLMPILTNSTLNIPVVVSLDRATAQEMNLAGDAAANATYADLPQFVTMMGTIGSPKPKIDYAALGKMALKFGSGIVNSFKELTGSTNSTTSATTTNLVNEGQQLFKGIKGLFNKKK